MPKLTNAVPKYRRHEASGQAVVTISGKDHYLGKFGSKASKVKHAQLVAEWVSSGRPSSSIDRQAPTVSEIILLYVKHAERYYVKGGRQTDEVACIKAAVKHVKALYGRTQAAKFGPLALQAVREQMIGTGICRSYINKSVGRIRRMFSWAVANELLPGSVTHALDEVPGLREGRSDAVDHAPVMPVDDSVVVATLAALPTIVQAMVQLQRLTGMRPEEVCAVKPAEIDRTGDVWLYSPPTHKMMHKGRARTIYIGPKAQALLLPYLFGDGPCFRSSRGRVFTTRSYRDAIHRAVKVVNRGRREEGEPEIDRWNPNQLRHAAATNVRREFGLEEAQLILGHSRADVTQVYAERDQVKAAAVARQIG